MDRLDDDLFRELRADAKAYIANLADNIGLLSEEADFLFFAKAHFPEAMGDFRGGGELLDADGSACTNVA
jgi:hypothetical protein